MSPRTLVVQLRALQRGLHPRRRERDTTQPDPGRIEHRIADRRRDQPQRHFGGSRWRRLGPFDQDDFDRFRNCINVQHRIAEPIDTGDHVPVKRHLLEHGAAGAIDELPVDDMPQRLRVDDHAHVMCADETRDFDFTAVAMDSDLGNECDEGREMPAERNAAANSDLILILVVARRRPLLPAISFRGYADGVAIARVLQIPQPEVDGIGLGAR